jgi:hypothetical protein
MQVSKLIKIVISILLACMQSASAQNSVTELTKADQVNIVKQQAFLISLAGSWEGMCRTWFKPGELADESEVKGEFQLILGERFLRHTYEAKLQGNPRRGEETISFNSITQKYQISWIDDFHMNYGIMFSEGEPTGRGFIVYGKYDVALNQPQWGWKTVFELTDKNNLIITGYNILPDSREVKAVETKYTRKQM